VQLVGYFWQFGLGECALDARYHAAFADDGRMLVVVTLVTGQLQPLHRLRVFAGDADLGEQHSWL